MKKALSLVVFVIVFTLMLFSCEKNTPDLDLADEVFEQEDSRTLIPPKGDIDTKQKVDEIDVDNGNLVDEGNLLVGQVGVSSGTRHEVLITKKGFEPTMLKIAVGDTVVWKNVRVKPTAVVLGAQSCVKIKSGTLKQDEVFEHTFTKVGRCPFIDGIYVTAVMDIVVK
jgi:plastocyanin